MQRCINNSYYDINDFAKFGILNLAYVFNKDILVVSKLNILQDSLQYEFNNNKLIGQALRHSSIAQKKYNSYERLEFLGDRVLGLVMADLIFGKYCYDSEGYLAKRHSYLVSEESLVKVANSINLENFIAVQSFKPGKNKSILADVMEAILAVIYLESGFTSAKQVIARLWNNLLNEMGCSLPVDVKSSLQELAQKNYGCLPQYKIIAKSGPEHDPIFKVQVTIQELDSMYATGKSIKEAEKNAAELLLSKLDEKK